MKPTTGIETKPSAQMPLGMRLRTDVAWLALPMRVFTGMALARHNGPDPCRAPPSADTQRMLRRAPEGTSTTAPTTAS